MNSYGIDLSWVLNKRIAVRCETVNEANCFIRAVLEEGPQDRNRYWRERDSDKNDDWTCWENSDTCYDIECNYDLCHCTADWYLDNGYEVWDFADILASFSEMEEVDDISFMELFAEGAVL